MESNTNNISSACLHGSDERQRRSETSEEKRSTCAGGRTHLVVVAISRFDAEPQSRGARLWLVYFKLVRPLIEVESK